MRRIKRLKLDNRTQSYLHRKQVEVNQKLAAGDLDTTSLWKNARQTNTLSKALSVLQRMFKWRNLLLCCSECGRLKGNRFPLQGKKPLLIDPTKEQPWRSRRVNRQALRRRRLRIIGLDFCRNGTAGSAVRGITPIAASDLDDMSYRFN